MNCSIVVGTKSLSPVLVINPAPFAAAFTAIACKNPRLPAPQCTICPAERYSAVTIEYDCRFFHDTLSNEDTVSP